mmetsp:Transcript_28218/g.67014  ORF Transcript_28218/g.67014 Transcript_28218/m.67014 type:complete len:507 (+) Transcript_28218:125-1645(+)
MSGSVLGEVPIESSQGVTGGGTQASPPQSASPDTPSTIRRFLTPFKAAGEYLFSKVSLTGTKRRYTEETPEANNRTASCEVNDGLENCTGVDVNEHLAKGPADNNREVGQATPAQGDSAPRGPQGSLLSALKQQRQQTGAGPSVHTENPANKPSNGVAHVDTPLPKTVDGFDTPYSSVLKLLREGPARKRQAVASWSNQQQPMASSGRPPTPSIPRAVSTRTGGHSSFPQRALPVGTGLFSMGATPGSTPMPRGRSRQRSIGRAPVVPLLTAGQAEPPEEPSPHAPASAPRDAPGEGSGAKPSSRPVWTPMRSCTMALAERDGPTSGTAGKRLRETPQSGGRPGTPLVGTGISSLKSYAISQPNYRRRVRPKKDTPLIAGASPITPAGERAVHTPGMQTPGTDGGTQGRGGTWGPEGPSPGSASGPKLSTDTARRILMTLDSLAAKTPTSASGKDRNAPRSSTAGSGAATQPKRVPGSPGAVPMTRLPQLHRPRASLWTLADVACE